MCFFMKFPRKCFIKYKGLDCIFLEPKQLEELITAQENAITGEATGTNNAVWDWGDILARFLKTEDFSFP